MWYLKISKLLKLSIFNLTLFLIVSCAKDVVMNDNDVENFATIELYDYGMFSTRNTLPYLKILRINEKEVDMSKGKPIAVEPGVHHLVVSCLGYSVDSDKTVRLSVVKSHRYLLHIEFGCGVVAHDLTAGLRESLEVIFE